MKKLTIILLLLIAARYGQAQKEFTLTELQTLTTYSQSDFDTYILTNGYSVLGYATNEVKQTYKCDVGIEGHKNLIERTKNNQGITFIAFTTIDKDYYLKSKEVLKKTGYKETETRVIKDESGSMPVYYYSNGKYTVACCTNELNIPSYTIQVFKN